AAQGAELRRCCSSAGRARGMVANGAPSEGASTCGRRAPDRPSDRDLGAAARPVERSALGDRRTQPPGAAPAEASARVNQSMRNWSVLLPFALGLAYGVWMITSRLDRLGR